MDDPNRLIGAALDQKDDVPIRIKRHRTLRAADDLDRGDDIIVAAVRQLKSEIVTALLFDNAREISITGHIVQSACNSRVRDLDAGLELAYGLAEDYRLPIFRLDRETA